MNRSCSCGRIHEGYSLEKRERLGPRDLYEVMKRTCVFLHQPSTWRAICEQRVMVGRGLLLVTFSILPQTWCVCVCGGGGGLIQHLQLELIKCFPFYINCTKTACTLIMPSLGKHQKNLVLISTKLRHTALVGIGQQAIVALSSGVSRLPAGPLGTGKKEEVRRTI